MFVEVQDTSGDSVWINTHAITFIRDDPSEDYLSVYFRYGDLYICRGEKKRLMTALRRGNMLVEDR